MLHKYVYRMSTWNQSSPFNTSLLNSVVLKTQTGWDLMFFVTDTSWNSYCFVVQFQCLHNCGLIFLHLLCWQQNYLPHIRMPLSLLHVTSSRHMLSHLLFPLIIACFLSRTAAAISERWQWRSDTVWASIGDALATQSSIQLVVKRR